MEQKSVGNRYPAVIDNAKLLDWVNSYSRKNRLDPRLVYALIEQESRFNPRAVSPKGAQGLMQIMPDTQHLLGLSEPFDPERNIAAGTRYLRDMLDKFQTELALAAYNAVRAPWPGITRAAPSWRQDYCAVVVRYFFLTPALPGRGYRRHTQEVGCGGGQAPAVSGGMP
jgi:soluble lytic murein transglycosylase-like protein